MMIRVASDEHNFQKFMKITGYSECGKFLNPGGIPFSFRQPFLFLKEKAEGVASDEQSVI